MFSISLERVQEVGAGTLDICQVSFSTQTDMHIEGTRKCLIQSVDSSYWLDQEL